MILCVFIIIIKFTSSNPIAADCRTHYTIIFVITLIINSLLLFYIKPYKDCIELKIM